MPAWKSASNGLVIAGVPAKDISYRDQEFYSDKENDIEDASLIGKFNSLL